MLILTRRVGEALMIGDEINVTVLGIKGNQVRIGVSAPKHVAVHRAVLVAVLFIRHLLDRRTPLLPRIANGDKLYLWLFQKDSQVVAATATDSESAHDNSLAGSNRSVAAQG